jgi:hypothetical protein
MENSLLSVSIQTVQWVHTPKNQCDIIITQNMVEIRQWALLVVEC